MHANVTSRRLISRQVWLLCCGVLFAIAWLFPHALLRGQENQFLIDANTVEAWIFQRHGNRNAARRALDTQLTMKIGALKKRFELNADQVGRLEMAARGDFKHFFDAADLVIRNLAGRRVGQGDFQMAWQITAPLREKLQHGLLDDESLFSKTLIDVLDGPQAQLLLAEEASRRRRRLDAVTRSYLARVSIDWPLTAEQMELLTEQILKRLERLRRTDQYTTYLVGYAVSQIPTAELRQILDESQMPMVDFQVKQFRRMEPMLREQGMLEERNDAP